MRSSFRWALCLLLLGTTLSLSNSRLLLSQEAGEPLRELFVPFDDLNLLLESEPNRVFLTRAEYEQLIKDARQTPQLATPTDATLVAAGYEGQLVDGRITLRGELTLDVLAPTGIYLVPLDIQGLGIQSATLAGEPAALTMREGRPHVIVQGKGKQSLSITMTGAANIDAAQQTLQWLVPTLTATTLQLDVGGNVDIKSGASTIARSYDETTDVTRFNLLPSQGRLNLTMSVNNRQRRDEQVVTSQSVLVTEVTQGYERLYATVSYRVLQGAVRQLTLTIPNDFDVTQVDTTLLSRWEQITADDDSKQLIVDLREPATNQVVLRLTANRSPTAEQDWIDSLAAWNFPVVAPLNVSSHVSVLGVLVEERLQARLFKTDSLMPLDASVLAKAIPSSVLDAEPGAPAVRQVAAFFAPQNEYSLSAEVVRPSVEMEVASSQVLVVDDEGLLVTGQLVVSPTAERRFDLDLTLPSEWELERLTDPSGNPVVVEKRPFSDSEVRYSFRVASGIAAGSVASFSFRLRHTPEGWLEDWDEQQISFPKIAVPGATSNTGALAVQTLDDLSVTPGDPVNLIPILENEKAGLGIGGVQTAFAYRFDTNDYELPLNVTRTPPILNSKALAFFRVKPGSFDAHYELQYEIQQARVRTLVFDLPIDTPPEVQIRTFPVDLVAEISKEETDNSRQWSVKLTERQLGSLSVLIDFQQPMDLAEATELDLPIAEPVGVELHSGFVAVEGDPELEIGLTTEARRVDVGELTTDSYVLGRRLVGSFGYVGTNPGVSASIETRVAYALPPAITQRAELVSQVSTSGRTQSVARYSLLSKASLLEIVLPPDSTLWTVFLDGEPTKPQRDGERLLLGLSSQATTQVRDLKIVFETETGSIGLFGELTLAAPSLSVRDLDDQESYLIPQADLQWRVILPTGHQIQSSQGTVSMTEQPQPLMTLPKLLGFFAGATGGVQGVAAPMVQSTAENASLAYEMDGAGSDAPMAAMDASPMDMGGYEDESVEEFAEGGEGAMPGDDPFGAPGAESPPSEPAPTAAPQSAVPGRSDSSPRDEEKADRKTPPVSNRPESADSGEADADKDGKLDAESKAKYWALEGVSSLKIDLATGNQDAVVFESVGEMPLLKISTVDRRGLIGGAWAIAALAILVGLAFRKATFSGKVRYIAALAFLGLLPLALSEQLAGISILFDALLWAGLLLIPIYLVLSVGSIVLSTCCECCRVCCRRPSNENSRGVSIDTSRVGALIIGATLAFIGNSTATAQEPPAEPLNIEQIASLLEQLQGPVKVPNDAILVPYDPAADIQRQPDQQILVPYEHYAKLWNLAHPDQPLETAPAPVQISVASSTYQTTLSDEDSLRVRGTFEIISYSDKAQVVPFRLASAVVVQALLDEEPARLQFAGSQNPVAQKAQQKQAQQKPPATAQDQLLLLVEGKGRHQFVLDLQVATQRQGAWQVVNATFPVAVARQLSVDIPLANTELRQQGLFDVPTHESVQDNETWKSTLAETGALSLRWRTKLGEAQIDQALTVQSSSVFDIRDDAMRLAWKCTLEFGRSTRDAFTFDVPGDYTVEQVLGTNVRGFTVRPEADRQIVDVTLLKPVANSETLTLILAKRAASLTEDQSEVNVPVILVRGAALESGDLMIRRSPRIELQAVLTDGVSRSEQNNVLQAMSAEADVSEASILSPQPFQTYRYVKPPFVLRLQISPLNDKPTASIRAALQISERQITLDTAVTIIPRGQPVYQVDIKVPDGFAPDRVGNGDQEWSLVRREEESILTVRYLQGQTVPFVLPLIGKLDVVLLQDEQGVRTMAIPSLVILNAKAQTGEFVVVPDPDTDVQTADLVNCTASSVNRGPGWLGNEQQRLARAQIRCRNAAYSGTLRLIQRTPQVTSRSVTNVLVTPRSVEETILFDFNIQQAGIRQISILVPDSLANARLNAKLLKSKRLEPATDENGNEIAGWQRLIIELQDDIRGAYSLLLQSDRLLTDESQAILLPFSETGDVPRRFLAVENAGRDEVLINPDQITGLESINRQQGVWNELSSLLGSNIASAFVANDDPTSCGLELATLERQQVERAGARIGLAETTMVVDESGGYRAMVDFRISNANEPFLEVELPEGATLWTVTVASEPGKAIQVPGGTANRIRIPLVKTAEGEGDYPVQIKYAGRMQLGQFGSPVSFPLLQSTNINIELSQVRLLLPKSMQWVDFNGTMRLVQDEGELARGFQSYLNKRIQEATQALNSSGNEFSKVRAAVSLNESRALLEDNARGVQLKGGSKFDVLLERNSQLLAEAEEQAQTELADNAIDYAGNRGRLNSVWNSRSVERAKNMVNDGNSNFESSYGRQAQQQSGQSFNYDWLRQNALQTDVEKEIASKSKQGENDVAGAGRQRVILAEDESRRQRSRRGQALDNLQELQIDEAQNVDLAQQQINQPGSAGEQAGGKAEQLRRYQQQLEYNQRNELQQAQLGGTVVRGAELNSPAIPQPSTGNFAGGALGGMNGPGPGAGSGGIGGGGFGQAGAGQIANPLPGGQQASQPGFMAPGTRMPAGGPAQVQLDLGSGGGLAQQDMQFLFGNNADYQGMGDTGLASLEVMLAERGTVYRFTTPRGETKIQARPIKKSWMTRGGKLAILGVVLVIAWILTRKSVVKIGAYVAQSLAFAILLGLAGLVSCGAGPFPLVGFLCLVASVALLVRWFLRRRSRHVAESRIATS